MSYSIKQVSVILTVQQFRAIITLLEELSDVPKAEDARVAARGALEALKAQDLLSEHTYCYEIPLPLSAPTRP